MKSIQRLFFFVVLIFGSIYLYNNPNLSAHYIAYLDKLSGVVKGLSVGESSKYSEITSLFKDMGDEIGFSFSKDENTTFDWLEKEGENINEKSLEGVGINLEEVSPNESTQINEFFKDLGFKPDVYNIASGTVSGVTGFVKDNIVCKVQTKVSNFDPDKNTAELESGFSDVKIICGFKDKDEKKDRKSENE